MARKTKTPPPVSAVDVNALGVSGDSGKSKQPPGRSRGCLKWAMLLLVGACGFSYLVSPPKAPTATPTAAAIATIVVTAEQVAAAATIVATDIPPSATIAPSATITETPVAMTAQAVVPVQVVAATATGVYDGYIAALNAYIAENSAGQDIQRLEIDQGGGNLNVTYNSLQGDATTQADEMIEILKDVGFFMYLKNHEWRDVVDVKTITLLKTVSGRPSSVIVADANKTINFAASPNRNPRTTFEASLIVNGSANQSPTANMSSGIMAVDPKTYYSDGAIRVRECASTNCAVIASLGQGDPITVDGMIDGDAVNAGNKIWYHIKVGDKTGYVYSDLVSTVKPAALAGGGVTSNNNQSVVPVPQSVPTASGGFVCPSNCTEAKAMGVSAQQAASCGLDRDGDGVACYGD